MNESCECGRHSNEPPGISCSNPDAHRCETCYRSYDKDGLCVCHSMHDAAAKARGLGVALHRCVIGAHDFS